MKCRGQLLLLACHSLLTICACENVDFEETSTQSAKMVWSETKPAGFFEDVMPAIENGRVFVGADTTLGCYELATGRLIWKSGLGIVSSISGSRVLLSGGTVFLNHSRWVRAFDKSTGMLVWECNLDGFSSIDLEAMTQNSTHLFLGGKGEVVRLSKQTGQIDLRVQLTQMLPGEYLQGAYDPVVSWDGYLYVPTGYFTGLALKGNLLCYDAETGRYIWGYAVDEAWGSDVMSCDIQDTVVVFPSGQNMIALNRLTGKKMWRTFINDDGFWYAPKISGESVYMGSTAQARLYAFNLRSGSLLWRSIVTRNSILTFITVENNRVYFSNRALIFVLHRENGGEIWSGLPPEYVTDRNQGYSSPLAVGEGHMVCVGPTKIYCLKVP